MQCNKIVQSMKTEGSFETLNSGVYVSSMSRDADPESDRYS